MVVRDRLEDLRQRSKEEKTAIAAGIALAVVAVLFVGWLIFFFRSIKASPAPGSNEVATSTGPNGLENAQQAFQQAYGSSTQFIDVQGNTELEPVGTTTESQ